MSYAGTQWMRKSDGVRIAIVGDSNGDGYEYVRAKNLTTGREFWVTKTGLSRKYKRLA